MLKCVYGHMRTGKAQSTACSGPSLSAVRITGHYRMYQGRANCPKETLHTHDMNLNLFENTFLLGVNHA